MLATGILLAIICMGELGLSLTAAISGLIITLIVSVFNRMWNTYMDDSIWYRRKPVGKFFYTRLYSVLFVYFFPME